MKHRGIFKPLPPPSESPYARHDYHRFEAHGFTRLRYACTFRPAILEVPFGLIAARHDATWSELAERFVCQGCGKRGTMVFVRSTDDWAWHQERRALGAEIMAQCWAGKRLNEGHRYR